MKQFKFFAMVFIALSSITCSQEDVVDAVSNDEKRYFTISIGVPTTRGPEADEVGTADENKIHSVYYFGFAEDNTLVTRGDVKMIPGGSSSEKMDKHPDMTKIFVVVNPTLAVKELKGETFTNINDTIATDLAHSSLDKGFMMTNNGGLVSVAAGANTTNVVVARVVAKVVMVEAVSILAPDLTTLVTVDAFLLHGTNKKMFLYSDTVDYDAAGVKMKGYRKDPNYQQKQQPTTDKLDVPFRKYLGNHFNYLKNTSDHTFIPAGSAQYCPENTSEGFSDNDHNPFKASHNLTKILFKASFKYFSLPDDSWFSYGTREALENGTDLPLSFYNLKKLFLNDAVARKNITALIQDAAAREGVKMQVPDIFFADMAALETKLTDAVDGYSFACVEAPAPGNDDYGRPAKMVLGYYKKGICYYTCDIPHDLRVNVSAGEGDKYKIDLGKYGAVRNNQYKISITGVTGHGLPYIYDPTDPLIYNPNDVEPVAPQPPSITIAVSVVDWGVLTDSIDIEF